MSTQELTMMSVGGYHEYTGGVQYTEGYHEYTGGCSVHQGVIMSTPGGIPRCMWGYHEYTGGCSVHWRDTMSTPGDIMSTLGGVQYTGGIP